MTAGAAPDLSSAGFRAAVRDGSLPGTACRACGRKQATPAVRCPGCGSDDVVRVDLAREGVVESFTIQRVAAEEWVNDVPFAIAVIRLDDGASVVGRIPNVALPDELPLGTRVRYVPGYRPGIEFEKASPR
ncbi:MAG TPA: OB-fold domain-containing protein [Candidatus Thermoplasmatota archaeon]|nr:OB-fold domain-containing protein [Candidatus Thermoplasmatota archaeon]